MFKILIIDPNIPFQQSLKKLLVKYFPDIGVEVAGDGNTGLKKIETFHPHLILLEIHLGENSGLTLARKIKSEHPDVIIALLTSFDSPEYQDAVKESGIEHLIPKDEWAGEDIVNMVQSISSNIDTGG
jgi:two-component system response regulator YesN